MTNHTVSSRAPRLVLALALLAGVAFVASRWSWNDSAIDPELLRLLERAPFEDDGTFLSYFDLETARRGPTTEFTLENGETLIEPDALAWSPGLMIEASNARRYPAQFEDAYGYTFDDIQRTFTVDGEQSRTFVVLDGDASAALDRATTPPWARQEVRSQIGAFDVLDWGDDVSVENRTDLRHMGQTGQLTAFDGNVIVVTTRREQLDPVLATQDGAPTLAQQPQLMAALALMDSEDSLGFLASIAQDNDLDDGEGRPRPPLVIVETALDGTGRAIIGFAPDTDVDRVEAGMQELIGPSAEPLEGLVLITTVFSRSDDFIIVDITSEAPSGEPSSNWDVLGLILNIFSLDPDLFS